MQKKTKIVATLGPASNDKKTIHALFEAGVNVFRLNFSHGDHKTHKATFDHIRDAEKKFRRPIGILADMQGPKHRIGMFEGGSVTIKEGQTFTFDLKDKLGDSTRVYLPHPEVIKAVKKDEIILLDDGQVRVRVKEKKKDALVCVVEAGKKLKDKKGFNLPFTDLDVSALTEKDRVDLDFALKLGVDWIALSFVQAADDVAEAKKIIQGRAGVIAKIEKPQAVKHIDAIIEIADGIMVARGDLGVEMPAEEVPPIQKKIIRKCREVGKPVIVATQMLESMTQSPAPTRAEASDVASAVYEGTDAVMLSAETAAGDYPIEAVRMMAKIARFVEGDETYHKMREAEFFETEHTSSDAITVAAKNVADTIDAAVIANFTSTGSTTLRTSRIRPSIPILALTSNINTARRLALSYGAYPFWSKEKKSFAKIVDEATAIALKEGLAQKGQKIVITAGVPFGVPGSTNTLRIAWT